MINSYSLSELSEQFDGSVIGSDVEFSNLSTDTRQLSEGDVYLALVGENFDGHSFVEVAKQNGAAAAIVSNIVETQLPLLKVKDTHEALADIALVNRRRSAAKVAALTGSQGKTTVKEMVNSILKLAGKTLATSKNLNNTIGVPLTLLQLQDHKFAVIEMGANSAGEIDFSARATEPDIVLITKASAAHIEGFGSLQGIVQAKGEILDHLKPNGVALLNADDENVKQWVERVAPKKTEFFSLHDKGGSDYFASDIKISSAGESTFRLHTPKGIVDASLKLLGEHNVFNAVAAASIAVNAGASLDQVAKGLSTLDPIPGRLVFMKGVNGCGLLDDTYNASPDSFFSAIDVLMCFEGKKIVIVGDMKELGDESLKAHKSVGEYAKSAGVTELWATGEWSKHAAEAFGSNAVYFETKRELSDYAKNQSSEACTLLIKGSRGSQMNEIVSSLQEEEDI